MSELNAKLRHVGQDSLQMFYLSRFSQIIDCDLAELFFLDSVFDRGNILLIKLKVFNNGKIVDKSIFYFLIPSLLH